MRIAILGPRGTFSEEAALRFPEKELGLCSDIDDVFASVIHGDVDMGIVPVENSLEGSVGMTLELLRRKDVKIAGEMVVDIRHILMAMPGTKLDEVKEVISHPHALAQCKAYLKDLGVKSRNFASTAEAAKEISMKGLKGVAAIAPRISAELYGLEILDAEIQDEEVNQTRFLMVANHDHKTTGHDKTSLILELSEDRPGALFEILKPFAEEKINLTKIESRPSRKALGDYIFYVDFEGHREDPIIKKVLDGLEKNTASMKVLGSYPMESR
ncbi:MAG: prephenate dehydratase [Candidatus Hydrothermarchaeales archaeon]